MGHRIACINRESKQRAFKFIGVVLDAPQPAAADRLHLDRLAERALQEIRLGGDQLVEVKRLGVEHLAPRKGEQTLG